MTTATATQYQSSSVSTRIVYAIVLTLLALPLIFQVRYAWILSKQMPTNPNLVNLFTAIVTVLVAAVLLTVVVYRIAGLVRGRITLDVSSTGGWLYALRIFSLILMYAGVLVLIASLLARYLTGISAVLLIAGEFRNVTPVGVVLFEFCRLLERERSVSPHAI